MAMAEFLETWGDGRVLAATGACVGFGFGFLAQRSRFCLRAAAIEFWHLKFGPKLSVWLLAFAAAVIGVQVLALSGALDSGSARQIASRGSLSGAAIGGLLFGVGMVMARGCTSRLLILSANGNLRALLSGLIFAVTAQASLSGALVSWRETVSGWWTVEGGASRDLLALWGVGHGSGLALGLAFLVIAISFARRSASRAPWLWIGGLGTGLCVAAAWGLTQWVARNSFEPLSPQGVTFSGPSAEWLMRVLVSPAPPIGFEFGLLPGVFLGSLIGALIGRDFKIEGFQGGYSMARYIGGAVLMGFGAMLAGGCAVGAGITGGAIFALTAWVSLICMWGAAGVADRLLDHAPAKAPTGTELYRAP